MLQQEKTFPYSWEEAIDLLRRDPQHRELIYDAYLTSDLQGNCRRFAESAEFAEVLKLIRAYRPDARDVLDVPAGNGIATYAFARAGFSVVAVEPDPSTSVGRGAIVTSLSAEDLEARIVDAFGEKLPFDSASFDVVYVRQGLHHARDLKAMLREYARVLRPGGVLLGCREHVVDNYGSSLREFLDAQVDHQLYGGENAFTLADYRAAFSMHISASSRKSALTIRPSICTPIRLRGLRPRFAGRPQAEFLVWSCQDLSCHDLGCGS